MSIRTNERGLERVISPLADYICASERPGETVKSVLKALFREVEQTNRDANARVAAWLEKRIALTA